MPASIWMRRVLFVVALLAIPFPYQTVEAGRVPAAWLATLSGLVVTSAWMQGGQISEIIGRWLAIQAGIAIVLSYVVARLGTAIVRSRVPVARQWLAVGVVAAAALGAAALLPIFATPSVLGGEATTLVGIFALR
jgi:hypothetical protein